MIRTLSKSIREYKKPSLLSPLFVALEVVFECIIPLVMANMIDHMNGSSMAPILQDGFILIVLSMASLFCGRLAAIQAAKGATGFAKNLRKDMFYNIQSLSFADVDKFSTSSLVTRMTTDVTNVQTAYSMIIRALIRAPFMIIFSIVMTISINAKMSLIFLAILPFLAAVLFGIAKYVHPIFVKIFHKYDAMNDTVQENVNGVRVVKSFVREDHEKKKFQEKSDEIYRDFVFVEKVLAVNNPVMMFSIFLAILLVAFLGAQIIINTHGSGL